MLHFQRFEQLISHESKGPRTTKEARDIRRGSVVQHIALKSLPGHVSEEAVTSCLYSSMPLHSYSFFYCSQHRPPIQFLTTRPGPTEQPRSYQFPKTWWQFPGLTPAHPYYARQTTEYLPTPTRPWYTRRRRVRSLSRHYHGGDGYYHSRSLRSYNMRQLLPSLGTHQ